MCGLSRQVVSHGSGLSRQVSLYIYVIQDRDKLNLHFSVYKASPLQMRNLNCKNMCKQSCMHYHLL